MKVLIFGANGLIGSNVLRLLLDKDYRVSAAIKGHDSISDPRLEQCYSGIDILRDDDLKDALNDHHYDAIIHCATPNDICSADFKLGVDTAIHGTKSILDYAVTKNIKKIIYVSTLQVYGTNLVGEYNENSQITLDGAYSYNHYCGELLCQLYSRRNKLSTTIIRPSNVYGKNHIRPFSRDTLVPECFVKELFSTGVIRLNSSGRQIRNFINVLDVAAQIEQALDENSDHDFLVQNACSSTYMSIADVAQLVSRKYGEKSQIFCQSLEPIDSNKFRIAQSNKTISAVTSAQDFERYIENLIKDYREKK